MYIRYFYKLCDFYMKCDNYIEVVNIFKFYVGFLKWTDDGLDFMLQSGWYFAVRIYREFKEYFYYDIIFYFDKGKVGFFVFCYVYLELEKKIVFF